MRKGEGNVTILFTKLTTNVAARVSKIDKGEFLRKYMVFSYSS